MKKLLILLLLLVSCSEPPIQYNEFFLGDRVRVMKGFYKRCIGEVRGKTMNNYYYVTTTCEINKDETIFNLAEISGDEMELLK